MKIAIDVDSTVFDILPLTLKTLNKARGESYTLHDVTHWHFFGDVIPFGEFMAALDNVTHRLDQEGLKFPLMHPDAVQSIHAIADAGHEVYFLSSMNGTRAPAMARMLESVGLGDYDLVVTGGSTKKESLEWDLLIDDCPEVECPKGRRVIQYPMPYNGGVVNWEMIPAFIEHGGVALSGKMRTGKDTFANQLCQEGSYVRVAQADALKEAAGAATGLDFFDGEVKKANRQFLIDYGKTMRGFQQNYWVAKAVETAWFHLLDGNAPVITDVRFENEFHIWKNLGFTMVRMEANSVTIKARGGVMLDDPSETELDNRPDWDYVYWSDEHTPDEILEMFLGEKEKTLEV